MLNPSASRLANPRTTTTMLGNPPPTAPATTANVVTQPSMPPRTASPRYPCPRRFERRRRTASGVCSSSSLARRSRSKGPLRLADKQDRSLGEAHQGLGLATHQGALQGGHPGRADDYEVGVDLVGHLDHDPVGPAGGEDLLTLHPGPAGRGLDLGGGLPAGPLELRHRLAEVYAPGESPLDVDGVECIQPRTERAGQVDGVLRRVGGALRPVGAD